MKILLYHEKLTPPPDAVLARARRRSHLLHKTIFWDIGLAVLLCLSGTLLLLYAPYLSQIPALRCFVPCSGSVWESLKLLYFPAAVTALLRWLVTGRLQNGILTTYATGLALTELLMTALLYTLRGITGIADIRLDMGIVCFCGIVLCIYLSCRANHQKRSNLPGMLTLAFMTAAFIRFTFAPPQIGLFL
ncbi:MAG: hypothetical protein IJ906_16315 [Oscillospiraceae bacterium]|nr:hypothetical protein [Oscillospiraceae bacterium]